MNKAFPETATESPLNGIPALLRGEKGGLASCHGEQSAGRAWGCVGAIVLGSAAFGAAIGCWRSPLQAWYTALKLPLIVLLTTTANGLLNGMLAPLLGLHLRFRQAFLAILMSFTIASAVLGAFAPLVAFLIWNAPALGTSRYTHSFILLMLVALIAAAGIAGNIRLLQVLKTFGDAASGRRTLLAWLAGNLLLGSQLSWILRPFVGTPGLPVEFFRDDALDGNFFEAVFRSVRHLFS